MQDESEVRAAAREILAELPRLLDEETAATVSAGLREALDLEVTAESARRIGAVLRHHRATRVWMQARLRSAGAAEPALRDYQDLPGPSAGLTGEIFVCSDCGSRWVRPTLEDPVQACEDHMVPVPRVRQGG
ncbi:hypothetical protein [Streptacidiphilus anmyonensis]|uniref:hypothetical protein n=1 Tax=Streptacidiphilus anmyonensis TaxID=405782 RepID=UPI0005AA5E98|nr:hypothetical protein [Streptacidiphilus anmyonensis]